MYKNSGGGEDALHVWRRCRCIKFLAVLQFLFLVQMRWNIHSMLMDIANCVSFIVFLHTGCHGMSANAGCMCDSAMFGGRYKRET